MRLPLLVRESTAIVLAGLADLDPLNDFLRPEGLRALRLTRTKGLVLLFAMNYADSSIGPYQELVIQVASSSRDHDSSPISACLKDFASLASVFIPFVNGCTDQIHRSSPLFMWKLFVTTPVALDAGKEIWGFPKDLAAVDVRVSSDSTSFEVRQGASKLISGARLGRGLGVGLPLSIDMRMISPKAQKQVLSRGLARGQALYHRFDQRNDLFELNQESEWGRRLHQIQFSPLLWTVMPRLQAAFFKP